MPSPRSKVPVAAWLFAPLIPLVACARSGPAPAVPTPSAPGGAAAEPTAWTWTAGVVPAWRVPAVIGDVIAIDAARALAVATGKLAVIDLGTGAVTVHDDALGGGSVSQLVRAGGRLLAYGRAGSAAAMWSVDPATPALTPLALPEPPAGAATRGRLAVAVSPDGGRLFTCSEDRWPTLRDAATLAPQRVFTGVDECGNPRFLDDGRVLIDRSSTRAARVLDLARGTVAETPAGAPLAVPGPDGRTASVQPGKVTLAAAGGAVVATYATGVIAPQWLADGSALVAVAGGRLTVLAAAPGQAARTLELPARVRRLVPIPGSPRLLFQVGAHRLGVLDPVTGEAVTAAGANLGPVVQIAALDGAVVSAAERVRVWRDRQAVAATPLAVVEMLDVEPGRPALYATLDGVFSADLRTGQAETVDAEAASTAVDRDGERAVWDRDERVMIRTETRADREWFRRSSDYFVTDLDVATGRVAMTSDDAYYVARPDDHELFGFHAADCDTPLYLRLERGRERAASYDGVTVHLYDTEARTALGGLELVEDNIEALTFVPGSRALALVGAAVYLWDPVADTVVAWPLPAELDGIAATAIGVDPDGTELAVGFADGAVLWARLDAVRARATAVAPELVTQLAPAELRCAKAMAADLAEVRGLDAGAADDEVEPGDDEADAD